MKTLGSSKRYSRHIGIVISGHSVPVVNKKGVQVLDIVDYDEVRALAYDIPDHRLQRKWRFQRQHTASVDHKRISAQLPASTL